MHYTGDGHGNSRGGGSGNGHFVSGVSGGPIDSVGDGIADYGDGDGNGYMNDLSYGRGSGMLACPVMFTSDVRGAVVNAVLFSTQ
jgi:hypothetical protein